MKRLLWSTRTGSARAALPVLLTILAIPACNKAEPPPVPDAKAKRVAQASCGNQAAFDQLKALAFKRAKEVRTGDAATLDRLAAAAAVRMNDPAAQGRDDALNVTLCKGQMAIDLPPGFRDAFNGDRSVTADVKYAVQARADHGIHAYPLEGVEPIVYRLAAIDLKNGIQIAQNAPAAQRPFKDSARLAVKDAPSSRRVAALEPPLSARGRPAYGCRYARSRAERMICTDTRLAAFDRVTASLYDRALDDSDRETRAVLRGTQGRFFARRDRCRSAACMAAAYRARLDEIDRIASES